MDDFAANTIKEYRDKVHKFNENDITVRTIVETVARAAAEKAIDAGYNGAMNDGGADRDISALNSFLDGIHYAGTGCTVIYGKIAKQVAMERDEEYQAYLKLKAKFE